MDRLHEHTEPANQNHVVDDRHLLILPRALRQKPLLYLGGRVAPSLLAVPMQPAAVVEFEERLAELGLVRDLLVAGSLATSDYASGVSDFDLVAVVDGPVDSARRAALAAPHRHLDQEQTADMKLGCVYVSDAHLLDVQVLHPTWTHGVMVDRILSGIARAELVRHGLAVFGRPPLQALAEVHGLPRQRRPDQP